MKQEFNAPSLTIEQCKDLKNYLSERYPNNGFAIFIFTSDKGSNGKSAIQHIFNLPPDFVARVLRDVLPQLDKKEIDGQQILK